MSLKNYSKLQAFSAVFSGLGMGLLLGMIMGLSVSPTVKVVMGSLAALLGAFLGLDGLPGKKKDSEAHDSGSLILTGLRTGSFGFAVVVGMLSGMIIRTNEMFAPTIEERMEKWTRAGFSKEEAKKIVLYQKLGIDPVTGEAGEIGDLQRSTMQNLFSSEGNKELSELLDPDLWNNDIDVAVEEVEKLDFPELLAVFKNTRELLPSANQFDYLRRLQVIIYQIEQGKTNYCNMPEGMIEWQEDTLRDLGDIIGLANSSDQPEIITNLKILFCKLETAK